MASLLDCEEVKHEISRIRGEKALPNPPTVPQMPLRMPGVSVAEHLNHIQSFIESFEYNYTGKPFITMNRSRGMSHILSVSKQLIREAVPIQCVEAVFLGTYLTAGMEHVERVPLSFKTKFLRGTVHRHIVLAVRHEGKWGALGISRRPTLMNKDLQFTTLADLVEDYRQSYEACYHKLLTIYIGFPLPHDVVVDHPVKWRANKIRIFNNPPETVRSKITSFTQSMGKMNEIFRREGTRSGAAAAPDDD